MTEPEARKELTEALALLLQLRDVGAMGERELADVAPAIGIQVKEVESAIGAWLAAKGQQ
jgi:hypothetical protein